MSATPGDAVPAPTPAALVRELPFDTDLAALQAADPARWPGLLESAAEGARGRWDLLFGHPVGRLELGQDGVLRRDGALLAGVRFLDALDAAAASAPAPAIGGLPCVGGWLLYLGYELAGEVEPRLRLPAAPDAMPRALALRCPVVLVRDRREHRCYAVAEAGHEAAIEALADPPRRRGATPPLPVHWSVEDDPPARFLDGVERVLDYLAAGDVFQANLSRGWRARPMQPVDPARLYQALVAANPAPFAGCLRLGDAAVLSSSPERLLLVDGDRAETRPIAGTRPRLPGDDEAARVRELVGHPKERAEHIMLIDLERNDLGRVCEPGSVRVEELMAVESYAHVHHIESTVAGRLRPGTTPGQAIAAVFPGGTITGCPKVRCMEIIAELEGVGRGAYTGALGYLSRHGRMDLNILIRSLTWDGSELAFRAGAGIVADSRPAAELEETRAKARGLLRALGVA